MVKARVRGADVRAPDVDLKPAGKSEEDRLFGLIVSASRAKSMLLSSEREEKHLLTSPNKRYAESRQRLIEAEARLDSHLALVADPSVVKAALARLDAKKPQEVKELPGWGQLPVPAAEELEGQYRGRMVARLAEFAGKAGR